MDYHQEANPDIISCPCGARIRLPAQSAGRKFRCPKCQAELTPSARPASSAAAPAASAHAEATCSICQSPIGADEPVTVCPKCDQVHHRDCWNEVGGCGTYGCKQAPSQEKEHAAPPLSAWGDTKTCPICAEKIKAIAVKCRYCGTEFDTVDPLTLVDVRRKIYRSDALEMSQKVVIGLFVASLFGCLAPIVLIAGLCFVPRKHAQLAKEGPLYLVLGYASIGLSLLYSILMLVFALF